MINFENRLSSLKDRRQGSRERVLLESAIDSLQFFDNDLRDKEDYENLKELNSIKYAIGAMAPVSKRSTEISFEEGLRVAKNLIESLNSKGILASHKFQGSVALDIHIEGHSDIDVLIIKEGIVLAERPLINTYLESSDKRSMEDIIKELRIKSESILTDNFSKAKVDIKNNKSISLEGGSLKRKVDIVPSCWHDTLEYQKRGNESDRGINIYHKEEHKLIFNQPFKHMELIEKKDSLYNGNLKMAIRLMKNMIADMPDYKKRKAKKLSSFDLASIAYYMDSYLNVPFNMRIALVEKLRLHLNKLVQDKTFRDSIYVPDESRKIFNAEDYNEKVEALNILASDISDLAIAIFNDIKPLYVNQFDSNIILNKKVA
ncbi:hypothetical protein O8C85_09295 [Aliarcobacter butzleri]|uniref:hypothetical protein n=1 Tax=Aliarcobacter butzleri TaxID=28197 RepID=UPI00263C1341|nr:hypothetical protein [Aliarcobacter butzleri]MDN5098727.1 hypothetical protein [Aliarcobacter butzleri]